MTARTQADPRAVALDAYLEQQRAHGFSIETRSALQAVIVKPHPLRLLLRSIARARAEQRLVVSVDEHGEVTTLEAEPLRW